MSGLVNYSSEDDQDDFQYTKAGERERERVSRTAGSRVDSSSGGKHVKHRRERSKSSSSSSSSSSNSDSEDNATPPRKEKRSGGVGKNEPSKSGNISSYNNDEDKYKSDKRSDKYKDQRRDNKRDDRETNKHVRESRGGHRGNKDDSKEHDNGHWNDSKKYDDNKRHSKDYKRDSGAADYYRDEKRPRYDEKKSSSYHKERFNNSKSRYDKKKSYEDRNDERREDKRLNDDRRNSAGNTNTHRRDHDDRKDRRSNNDDRRTQRSYNQDRSSSYRSNNKFTTDRRVEDDRKQHQSRSDSPDKANELNSSHKAYPTEVPSSRPEESKSSSSPDVVVVEKKILPTARNFEALLSLPLSETALKQTKVVTVPPITTNPDVDAAATTIQLPSYYNPKVINPNKYAQQMQKRKLIWGAKKTEDVASKWGQAQFSQDSDGKVASKFMRLMGIKSSTTDTNTNEGEKKPESAPTSSSSSNNPDFKTREAMFSSMEQQYEVARQVTHTMRGVGLGFSSQTRPY